MAVHWTDKPEIIRSNSTSANLYLLKIDQFGEFCILLVMTARFRKLSDYFRKVYVILFCEGYMVAPFTSMPGRDYLKEIV